jgi:hypothetical protein
MGKTPWGHPIHRGALPAHLAPLRRGLLLAASVGGQGFHLCEYTVGLGLIDMANDDFALFGLLIGLALVALLIFILLT